MSTGVTRISWQRSTLPLKSAAQFFLDTTVEEPKHKWLEQRRFLVYIGIEQLAATRARLAPNNIVNASRIKERLQDWDMQASDAYYRHVSHLYSLYTNDYINVHDIPELAATARDSLEILGDETRDWGISCRPNLWACLYDAEHAYKILTMSLSPERTYPNMLTLISLSRSMVISTAAPASQRRCSRIVPAKLNCCLQP